jgi:CheY-like chemotaxis protein
MPKKNVPAVNQQNVTRQRKLILIVDDEFDLTSTFDMLFQINGFETVTANNGHQALERIRERVPDIIMSDCMMPVMDGIALSRHVRNNPATAHIPIILMSAIPQQKNLADAVDSEFMQKPFRFRDVLDLALQLLSAQGTDQARSD